MGTYHGPGTSLVIQQGDKLTVNPSRLATLTRNYACIDGYVATARTILVPGHVPDAYPYLSLMEKPQESPGGGITTFSCRYVGVLAETDFNNAYLSSRATLKAIDQTVIEYDATDTAITSTKSFNAILPQKQLAYVSNSLINSPKSTRFSYSEIGWSGLTPAAASATITPVLTDLQKNQFGNVHEVFATWQPEISLSTIYGPHQQVLPSPFFGSSSVTHSTPFYVSKPSLPGTLSLTATGGATVTSATSYWTVTPPSSPGTITLTLAVADTFPSGYNFMTDYDPANPAYYTGATATMSISVT